jgi:hypothetical protein
VNGKPFDHPVTDVTIHGMRVFSRRIDTLIAQIGALDGYQRLYADPEADRLLDLRIDRYGQGDPPPAGLEAALIRLRDELAAEARRRGENPEPAFVAAAQEVRQRWANPETKPGS